MSEDPVPYIIRCLHVDQTRPPQADDPYEFHWRCKAVFERNMYADPPDPPYCPFHRVMYRSGARATPEEVKEAVEAFGRFVTHVTMPDASRPVLNTDPWLFPGAGEKELEDDARVLAAAERKALLKAQAGQLSRDA